MSKSSKCFYIYCHTAPNGKCYIGQTHTDPERRWNNGNGYKCNAYFYRSIQKYGWDNFEHSILMVLNTKEMTDLLEVKLISFFDTTNSKRGFNISKGGDGPLGVKWTEEHRQYYSKLMSGTGNSMYGKHHSEETKAAISRKLTGRKLSDEERAKKTKYLLDVVAKSRQPVNQYDLDGNLIATHESMSAAARELGKHESQINLCCNGKRNTAYGFKWARVGEEIHEAAKRVRKSGQHDGMGVIQLTLDGDEVARYRSLSDAERATGLHRDRIGDCCHGGMDSYGCFVWRFSNENQKGADKTAVRQFDLDRNEICEFANLAEASAKTGIPRYLIRNCCRGKQVTARGFIWEFSDPSWQEKRPKPRVGVVQLDLDGNEVGRYKSLTEAMRATGTDRHRIVECCNGIKPSYHGSKWRYEEEN